MFSNSHTSTVTRTHRPAGTGVPQPSPVRPLGHLVPVVPALLCTAGRFALPMALTAAAPPTPPGLVAALVISHLKPTQHFVLHTARLDGASPRSAAQSPHVQRTHLPPLPSQTVAAPAPHSPAQPHAEPRAPTAAAEAIFSAAGRTRNMADRGGLEALDRGLADGQEAAPAPPPGSATRSRTSAARVAAALSDCCRYALLSCRYALLSRRYRRNSTTLSSRPRQNGGALWREPCVTQRGRAEAEP